MKKTRSKGKGGWKPSPHKIGEKKMGFMKEQAQVFELKKQVAYLTEIVTGFLPKFFVKQPEYVTGLNSHLNTNFSLTGIVSINEYNLENAV